MPPLALLLATLPVVAYDYDFEENGIYYLITSDDDLTCAVAPGNKAYAGNVVIPATATFEGTTYKVTAIAAKAFKDCKRLKSIDLGNVTKIGSNAFEYCTSLTTIDLKNVTELGKCAFEYCTSLTSVDLIGITTLHAGTFTGCKNLMTVKNAHNIKEIDNLKGYTTFCAGTFEDCTSLTSIDLPNVQQIGLYAFYGSSFAELVLPALRYAFLGESGAMYGAFIFPSTALKKLVLPKVENFLGDKSLCYSDKGKQLTELTLGEKASLFAEKGRDSYYAVYGQCTSMRKVTYLSAEPKYEQIGEEWFPNADVYVPKGSATAYKAYKAEHPNCFRNVYEFEPEVNINESAVTVRINGRYKLSTVVLPYYDYDSAEIQWESSAPNIADVSSKGVVFALSEGNATITAKYGNATATCAVKVSKTESVDDVKVDAATEYDVYNLQGIMVRSKCDKADIYDLPGGIYILVSPQGRTKVRI